MQQRHEIIRKGVPAACGFVAGDAVKRQLNQSEMHLADCIFDLLDLVQHRQVGRMTEPERGFFGSLRELAGVIVFVYHSYSSMTVRKYIFRSAVSLQ